MAVLGEVSDLQSPRIAVVIPCFKVTKHIRGVIEAIGPETRNVYCIDDACPDQSGDFIEANINDPRVRVVRHERNQGVGGAVLTGYRAAIADGADVIVKVDGDGQMDPTLLPQFVLPILRGQADYTKGNRFWDLTHIKRMPFVRRLGNLGLSFLAKLSSGYWDLFDPTNGYTAIHARIASRLPHDSISKRYFFETDMLFRLNTMRACIVDIPMEAKYGDEESNLSVSKVLLEFSTKHVRNFVKRIGYNYFLRDLSVASMELLSGTALLAFGVFFGGWHWWLSSSSGVATATGTVMMSALPVLLGIQLLLAFLAYDISNIPRRPLHPRLDHRVSPPNTGPL